MGNDGVTLSLPCVLLPCRCRYPRRRIGIAQRKLALGNPMEILCDELSEHAHVSKVPGVSNECSRCKCTGSSLLRLVLARPLATARDDDNNDNGGSGNDGGIVMTMMLILEL